MIRRRGAGCGAGGRRGLGSRPLGHYVLADVYNRQGRASDARNEVVRAQKLEAALRRNPQKQI